MKESGFESATTSLRGFWSLFATQFQGAFSDNVLKNLVIFMLVAMNLKLAEKHRIAELAGALLLLNVFFFGADVLKVREAQIGWLNAAPVVGIGLGSVAAGYLSGAAGYLPGI